MTTVYAIAMIAVAAVCTFATRVAPFLLLSLIHISAIRNVSGVPK